MSEITVADWKRQGVELRERLEAERDTLRHRLDQVTSDIIEIDRTLGTRPTPMPKQEVTRVTETVVKRNVGQGKLAAPDHSWEGSIAGAIMHVMRERRVMSRAALVQETRRITGRSNDQIQSNISALARQGDVRLDGTRGAMTVYYIENANGAAEAAAH